MNIIFKLANSLNNGCYEMLAFPIFMPLLFLDVFCSGSDAEDTLLKCGNMKVGGNYRKKIL